MKNFIKKNLRIINNNNNEEVRFAIGVLNNKINKILKNTNPKENEFKVFSQGGEDGIIQYIIENIKIKNKIFVEFGVENYRESNTKFLLMKDNWSGLIMDGSRSKINEIKSSDNYWKYNLQAKRAFITRENINSLLKESGIWGDIGLLSIDIDGVDYWVWDSINVISPRIVIIEYASIFGNNTKVVVPYKHNFNREVEHYSNCYFGASLNALVKLGEKKGYSLICCSSMGNNAFFVRNDVLGNLKKRTAKQAYIKAQYRESRDKNKKLTFLTIDRSIKLMKNKKVYDLSEKKEIFIKSLNIKYE
ncbi:hypothetical protein KAT36_03325 [Candidatus Pacearchaeota archaeon]|nr:hypothetical protein [Candidatus Pacearchaeota archaeon]